MKKPKKYLPFYMKLWFMLPVSVMLLPVLMYPLLILFPPLTVFLVVLMYGFWYRHKYLSYVKYCLKLGITPSLSPTDDRVYKKEWK